MKQPARSQDPLSMNGLGRALWNFLVLPWFSIHKNGWSWVVKKKQKIKHHIPIFWELCIFLGCPQYCLTYDVKRVCVFPFSLIEPSSPPYPSPLKPLKLPKIKPGLQEHPPFSSDGDFPVSHDVKLQFMYIQCEAPKIAKLVYNSNNYGLWYL